MLKGEGCTDVVVLGFRVYGLGSVARSLANWAQVSGGFRALGLGVELRAYLDLKRF